MKTKDFKIGGKDRLNREIVKIYSSNPEFVIYKAKTEGHKKTDKLVSFFIDDDRLKREDRIHYNNYLKIGKEVAKVVSSLPNRFINTDLVDSTYARALNQGLIGNTDLAKEMLTDLGNRLYYMRISEGRIKYHLSCATIVVIFFCISLIFFVDINAGFYQKIIPILMCGLIGGFLSVLIDVKAYEVDTYADKYFHFSLALTRMFIASIGSLFIYFCIEAKLIFASLDFVKNGSALYVISIVAGFSETLVPNVLKKIEGLSSK